MALDIEQIAKDMLAAALPLLGKAGQDAAAFVKVEFTKIAHTIVAIGEDLAAKRIDQPAPPRIWELSPKTMLRPASRVR